MRVGPGDLFAAVSPSTAIHDGDQGPPRFLSYPGMYMPRSSTPTGSQAPCLDGARVAAFRRLENVGAHNTVISELNHAACTFARPGFAVPVAGPPRRSRFRLLAKLCRAGFTPAG